jgi:hypothetical protein
MLSFKKTGNSQGSKTAKVDIVITSANGCRVHIKGTIKYTIFPPEVKSFTGTVSISGSGGCPNTVLTFAKSNEQEENSDVLIDFDTEDVCSVTRIIWYSDMHPETVELLNDNLINLEIVRKLNSLCYE